MYRLPALFGALLLMSLACAAPTPECDDDEDLVDGECEPEDDGGGGGGGGGGGTVTVDPDPFGAVGSVAWVYHSALDFESIIASSSPDICADVRAEYEASLAYGDAADAVRNPDDYCEEMQEPAADYARVRQDVFPVGSQFLSLSFPEGRAAEGTFEAPDEAFGYLQEVMEDYYEAYITEWDTSSTEDDDCGVTLMDPDDAFALRMFGAGSLITVSDLTSSSLSVELEGTLEDISGDSAGEISAALAADRCIID